MFEEATGVDAVWAFIVVEVRVAGDLRHGFGGVRGIQQLMHRLLDFKGTGHSFAYKDSLLANRCKLMLLLSLYLFSIFMLLARGLGVWRGYCGMGWLSARYQVRLAARFRARVFRQSLGMIPIHTSAIS